MPAPTGYIPLRSWFEGQGKKVNWNPATKTITAGSFTFNPGDYYLDEMAGRSYIDPANLAGMYLNQPTQQLTPQTFQQYSDVAKQLLEPMYNARAEALQRRLSEIKAQGESQQRLAEAAYQTAQSNLQRRETGSWNSIMKSAIARGLGASPLASYEQRKVAEAYAPEYQNLETNRAAQMANIASNVLLANRDLAGQTKELESDYLSNAFSSALQQFNQAQTAQNQQRQALVNYLLGLGQIGREQEQQAWQRERQTEADQWTRALQEAGLTGMWQGQPTWERQYQERQLAQAAARAASGGSRSGGSTLTERTRSSYGEALQGVADSLDALKQAYGSQDYADMFSTEYGILAPVQVIEQQINSQRAQLRAQGIDPDKLIDEAYKMAYGVGRDEYWKQANKALEGEF